LFSCQIHRTNRDEQVEINKEKRKTRYNLLVFGFISVCSQRQAYAKEEGEGKKKEQHQTQ
jgi:hypothetical protein